LLSIELAARVSPPEKRPTLRQVKESRKDFEHRIELNRINGILRILKGIEEGPHATVAVVRSGKSESDRINRI
jgi:hypothetical protein